MWPARSRYIHVSTATGVQCGYSCAPVWYDMHRASSACRRAYSCRTYTCICMRGVYVYYTYNCAIYMYVRVDRLHVYRYTRVEIAAHTACAWYCNVHENVIIYAYTYMRIYMFFIFLILWYRGTTDAWDRPAGHIYSIWRADRASTIKWPSIDRAICISIPAMQLQKCTSSWTRTFI